jgi:hypothetical protein
MQKLITMKELLILLLLLISNLLSAQRDPQWLMPLYFQDANGDRDTVYFGYDPEADMYPEIADTSLGENWIRIDRSKFNIYLWNYPNVAGGEFYLINDTVRKVDIRSNFIGAYIGFCKGKLPITMKWVDSLLYAPSCPFPDLSPRPRARIELTCSEYESGYNSCNPVDGPPLSLTDYPSSEIPFPVMDSMVFNGSGSYLPSDVIIRTRLTLVKHDFNWTKLDEITNNKVKLFPNPVSDKLTIQRIDEEILYIKIINISGESLFEREGFINEISIDMNLYRDGIYLLFIVTKSGFIAQKIIKLN